MIILVGVFAIDLTEVLKLFLNCGYSERKCFYMHYVLKGSGKCFILLNLEYF